MKIAIIQPYFFPYAGYFRLFTATDLVVIFDCVQFPRRGRVHRCELPTQFNEKKWLTLPIKKCIQHTLIKDLTFTFDAQESFETQTHSFPTFMSGGNKELFLPSLKRFDLSPRDYLIENLKDCCRILNLPFNILLSSQLNISPELKAQDRIIEICKIMGAKLILIPLVERTCIILTLLLKTIYLFAF